MQPGKPARQEGAAMKIAITCHASQGGSGIVATELAVALAGRGHEVHMVALEQPFRLQKGLPVHFHQVEAPEYPLFRAPPHDLSLANKLAQVVKGYDIDIIHAHYAVPHAVTALLARQIVEPRSVRVVTTLHGTDITLVGSHNAFFDLIRHAIVHSDAVTAVSDWLADETAKRFILEERPEVIPNFVDTDRFHTRDHAPYPEPGGEFRLIHASNLRPVKRVHHIIRVFHGVQKEVPARLMILGDGPDKGTAKELAAQLGICDKVTFNGISCEMPDVLRSSHLYLLLSDYESFGLSALEAMACGTPVAVSAAGGLLEIVNHGETGLLCPVGDDAFAVQEIVKLLRDRAKWRAMADCAAAQARDRFNVNQLITRYEALYERAMTREERK
jgi:N-acetyl-alpha-D-glucosaminyl L-malate synthase BshA